MFRAASVFGLTAVSNVRRLHKINFAEQFIVFYGGLRGAIAFALAFILKDDLQVKAAIVTTSLVVILFTVFCMGSTLKPVLKQLDIKLASHLPSLKISIAVFDAGIPHVRHFAHELLAGGQTGASWRRTWRYIDSTLMRYLCPEYEKKNVTGKLRDRLESIYAEKAVKANVVGFEIDTSTTDLDSNDYEQRTARIYALNAAGERKTISGRRGLSSSHHRHSSHSHVTHDITKRLQQQAGTLLHGCVCACVCSCSRSALSLKARTQHTYSLTKYEHTHVLVRTYSLLLRTHSLLS